MGRAMTAITWSELRDVLGFEQGIEVSALYVDPVRRVVHVVASSAVLIETDTADGEEPPYWPIDALRMRPTVFPGYPLDEAAEAMVRCTAEAKPLVVKWADLPTCESGPLTVADETVVGVRVIVGGCVECRGGMAIVRAPAGLAAFDVRCFDCGAVVPASSALYCP